MVGSGGKKNNYKFEIRYGIVSKIHEVKHILFADISDQITKNDKIKKWQEVFEFTKTIGGIDSTRCWSYLRDVYWPNVKRSTMTKVNRKRVLNQIDFLVLGILNLKIEYVVNGERTAGEINKRKQNHELVVNDSNIKHDTLITEIKEESFSCPNSPASSKIDDDDYEDDDNFHVLKDGSSFCDENMEFPICYKQESIENNGETDDIISIATPHSLKPSASAQTKDEMTKLRKRKLEEQVEYFRLQNVKTKLEIKEAEIRVALLEKDLEQKCLHISSHNK